jgi:heterotetrameric sarcosine oxidase gamma subunit
MSTESGQTAAAHPPGTSDSLLISSGDERRKLLLRGNAGDPAFLDIVSKVLGEDLPLRSDSRSDTDPPLIWVSPTAWLIVGRNASVERDLRDALSGRYADLLDLTHAYGVIRIAGDKGADLLATTCGADFHPSAFPPGRSARTLIAGVQTIVTRPAGDTLDLYLDSSLLSYLLEWLHAASLEFADDGAEADPAG